MKKFLLAIALSSAFLLSACTSEEISDFFSAKEVTVSGKTNNLSDAAEPDVSVEAVYFTPGDALNPATVSDSNGGFSLEVLKNDSFYLRASKSGFVSMNSVRKSLDSDESGIVIDISTELSAQDIINQVFTYEPPLADQAWLIVDVVDTNGDEINGQQVFLSLKPTAATYVACDGTISTGTSTVAPCTDRSGPMYIAFFDTAGEVLVTVDTDTQTAPISMGEITFLDFEQ